MSGNLKKDANDHVRYLIEEVNLNAHNRYTFNFLDGTGFFGTPEEFSTYAVRRFSVFPDDSYEILEDNDIDPGYCYEILQPESVGETLKPSEKKDPRF